MNARQKYFNFRVMLFLVLCITIGFNPAWAKRAKYVFFFIGDGMAFPQRMAAEQYLGHKLLMDTFPAQGMTTTRAANRFITGSAAAATALASGIKTNIGMIGITPSGDKVKTIAELAKEQGKKVGIISTVSIDHATPAGFYAHVNKRSQYYDIETQLAKSGFDFFGGGGFKDPTNKRHNSKNYQGDAREFIKEHGYKIIRDKQEFLNLAPGVGKVVVINPWLQDEAAEPYTIDQTPKDITLAELTSKAIELLNNKKGFFIMVEGGKIDWACHANDAVTAIKDTIALDNAIKVAYEFYKKHPKETLIVVTGDHETGGLTLGFAGTKYATYFDALHNQKLSFRKFTDEFVKKFQENKELSFDDVKPIITKYFGLKFSGDPADPLRLKPFEEAELLQAFAMTMKGHIDKHDPQTYLLYGGYDPLTVTITHLLNNKAGIGWTSYKHTGVPVPT
ncbi:MAG: alkaline phosphatase, partial [Desulfonauticus sp.]|nr:alkaline phosphatase [Desulfonauticus sp.]